MTMLVHNPRIGLAEHWLTFDEFIGLVNQGAFGPSRNLELIDGRVIDLAPIGAEHGSGSFDAGYAIRRALERAGLTDRFRVYSPVTLRISKARAPQPDVVVASPSVTGWVTPADAYLVVEFSVTTLDYDLGEKPAIYAAAGVPEYWVVDQRGDRVHIFRQPEGGTYIDIPAPSERGDTIAPLFAPDLAIAVADLL